MNVLLVLCGAYLVLGLWWAHQWGWYPDAKTWASWDEDFQKHRSAIIVGCIFAVVLAVSLWPFILWQARKRIQ